MRFYLDKDSELGQSLRMAEWIKYYEVPVQQIKVLMKFNVPEDLCRAYESELKEAVKYGPRSFVRLTRWEVGRITALALNESLSVHKAEKSNRSGTEYKIIVRYEDFGSKQVQFAMFQFSKLSGLSGETLWSIVRFQDPYTNLQ